MVIIIGLVAVLLAAVFIPMMAGQPFRFKLGIFFFVMSYPIGHFTGPVGFVAALLTGAALIDQQIRYSDKIAQYGQDNKDG